MPGVQTLVPMMLDHVNAGHLSLARFVDLTSAGPQRLFGIAGKGRTAVGYDADLTVVPILAGVDGVPPAGVAILVAQHALVDPPAVLDDRGDVPGRGGVAVGIGEPGAFAALAGANATFIPFHVGHVGIGFEGHTAADQKIGRGIDISDDPTRDGVIGYGWCFALVDEEHGAVAAGVHDAGVLGTGNFHLVQAQGVAIEGTGNGDIGTGDRDDNRGIG